MVVWADSSYWTDLGNPLSVDQMQKRHVVTAQPPVSAMSLCDLFGLAFILSPAFTHDL